MTPDETEREPGAIGARATDSSPGDDPDAELEHLTRELFELRREVEHMHRLSLAGRVAGTLAHEFNNILTPIMNYAEMALASPEDQGLARKALERALAGSSHASRVATSILTLVSGSEEMFHVEHCAHASCDVASAAEEAVACLSRPPERDGVELRVEVEPGLRVATDEIVVSQVLLNLMLNAVEAMRPGGGELSVRARALDSESVSIEVSDTGRGIPAERVERAFEPFSTFDRVMSDNLSGGTEGRSRGVGLGLTICRNLVERAGGEIALESAVGEGTRLRIRLPRCLEGALRGAA